MNELPISDDVALWLVPLLALSLAGGLGLVIGWIWATVRAGRRATTDEDEVTDLRIELAQAEARLAAQRDSTDQAAATFGALADEALRRSSEQLLTLADLKLQTSTTKHSAELDQRQRAIAELVRPLGEQLGRLDRASRDLESKRERAYAELEGQFKELALATRRLDDQSNALTTALTGSSQARGRWGELSLRRIVELAGMSEHCDFVEQPTGSDGSRPDMVVLLPGGGHIPIDSKVPLVDYIASCDVTDARERRRHLAAHTGSLRRFIRELARKDYAAGLDGPVDFTVMFLPGEPILAAACEMRPELQQEALEQRILIATPVTLVALLRTVGTYWRQDKVAESAQQVWDAARTLHERAQHFSKHLAGVGKSLGRAVGDYNAAVGSYAQRLIPAGRALEKLTVGPGGNGSLDEPPPVDEGVREFSPPS